jgi:hypothetical protein
MIRMYYKIDVLTQAKLYFVLGGSENESFGAGVADGRTIKTVADR